MENSVDLEMIGSTAPGSSIYNVYGLSPTNTTIDDALQSILSPSGNTWLIPLVLPPMKAPLIMVEIIFAWYRHD